MSKNKTLMKRNLLSLLLISIVTFASAQDLKIKKGEVSFDGQPYCKVTGSTGMFAMVEENFTVRSLSEKDLVQIRVIDKDFYEVVFLDKGEKMKITPEGLIPNIKNDILKKLYAGKMIVNNALDSVAKRTFILKHDRTEAYDKREAERLNEKAKAYVMAKRDRNADITIRNKEVFQGNVLICRLDQSSGFDADKNILHIMKYKLPNGLVAAELKAQEFSPDKNTVNTFKDEKTYSVDGLTHNMVGKFYDNTILVVRFLVERGYL